MDKRKNNDGLKSTNDFERLTVDTDKNPLRRKT